MRMQKRLVQVTATAVLFATMAMPAFAGNGHEKGRGWGFGGIGVGLRQGIKVEKRAAKDLKKMLRDVRKDARKDDDGDEDEAKSACLTPAEETYAAAIKAADAARETALAPARASFAAAIKAAMTARLSALASARTTFLASDMGSAAQAAFIDAYVKADADWHVALRAAQDAFAGARATAEAIWTAAKLKATADFKAAKMQCADTAPAPTPSGDTTAPSAVTNLLLSGVTSSSISLAWTAPGDDNVTGTAASYDVRYSTSPIVTAADFTVAAQATGEPAPMIAGSAQSMTVSGLTTGATYFFAIEAQDEAGNVSALSNVPSLATL